ncbi:MAG: hypothetical protein EOL89_02575 [Actinobacteria bacterium]|nr:hypothetical protein [Actinomycetota bacterium]
MTTRQLLHDAGHCLRAAAPPLFAVGVLAAIRSVLGSGTLSSIDGLLMLTLRAAIAASVMWLVAAACWAATRPWRDRRVHKQLQRLRDFAVEQNRVLVHIQTTIWSSAAGQHTVVLNIATGTLHRVWLSETTVQLGAFAVLEHTRTGVHVIDCMHARGVEQAHRHERHQALSGTTPRHEDPKVQPGDNDTPSPLVLEIEAFLRGSADSR